MQIPHLPPAGHAPRVVLDRFGQSIDPGDLVTYAPVIPCMYRVIAIAPDFRPNGDPGRVTLTLQADVQFQVPHGQPIAVLARVGYLTENGPVIGSPTRGPLPDAAPAGPVPDPVPVGTSDPDVPQTVDPSVLVPVPEQPAPNSPPLPFPARP